ncbi:MAG: DUF1778 domain-containing protein [Candidatus Omnitrophica bacterium]|nr:DUF1778 domain-containing protein [Candidatus Omnitrophota bacterium]MCA9418544.1 DUF1778 domain-containing protein [Candidatus Omnitrophota bacterium]MCB9768276.1 DUF1778 domain-containing protein [Candidatus Omnitrophota bacterium]MCB9784633.1 DUF1778 domain-containing protein [Candidatus Omnitrophota bacterium]
MPTPIHERSERLEARATRDQKALLKQAADIQGRSLSDFVVQAASDAAKKVVEEQQIIKLTKEEQEGFVKALLNPPKPGPRLRAAARRYQKAMGR